MTITKIGKITNPPRPIMHLGSACAEMVSVCMTAPDRSGNLAGQTRQTLDIIEQYLVEVGSSRKKLLMVQVWLADITGFSDFREVWNSWIDPDDVPALSVVEAQAARRDALVEIRVYAAPGSL